MSTRSVAERPRSGDAFGRLPPPAIAAPPWTSCWPSCGRAKKNTIRNARTVAAETSNSGADRDRVSGVRRSAANSGCPRKGRRSLATRKAWPKRTTALRAKRASLRSSTMPGRRSRSAAHAPSRIFRRRRAARSAPMRRARRSVEEVDIKLHRRAARSGSELVVGPDRRAGIRTGRKLRGGRLRDLLAEHRVVVYTVREHDRDLASGRERLQRLHRHVRDPLLLLRDRIGRPVQQDGRIDRDRELDVLRVDARGGLIRCGARGGGRRAEEREEIEED